MTNKKFHKVLKSNLARNGLFVSHLELSAVSYSTQHFVPIVMNCLYVCCSDVNGDLL